MCESRISNMFWPNPPMHNATSPLVNLFGLIFVDFNKYSTFPTLLITSNFQKTYYEPPLNSQFERFRYLWN